MNKDYKKLAEELEVRLGKQTEATKVLVSLVKKSIVEEGLVVKTDEYEGIEIRPCNNSTIYCMGEIVDFCRYNGLSEYVTMESEWDTEKHQQISYIKCHIF